VDDSKLSESLDQNSQELLADLNFHVPVIGQHWQGRIAYVAYGFLV